MEAFQEEFMTDNSENDLQPAVQELQKNINERNEETRNLRNTNITDDRSTMLKNSVSNSLSENINVDEEIESTVRNDDVVVSSGCIELCKKPEKEAICEVEFMTDNSKNDLQTAGQKLQKNINDSNIDTYNLQNRSITDDESAVLKNSLSNSLSKNINAEIEGTVRNDDVAVSSDFVELSKKPEKEAISEVEDVSSKMGTCQEEFMTDNSENNLQPAVQVLQKNTNESNEETYNLRNTSITDDGSTMLRNSVSKFLPKNINVSNDIIESTVRNDGIVELSKKPEKEAICEVEDVSSEKEISIVECMTDGGDKSKIEKSKPGKTNSNIDSYRCESDSWTDDEDESSSSSDSSSDSDFFQRIVDSSTSGSKRLPAVKTKGELGLDDLPPIEDLVITVQEEEMVLVGKIHAIVDKLVVIHALKDMKALDLDSVLFLSYNKPLGRVFDVFGPVVEPFYCVRFNSTDHINEKGIEIGSDVFFAPEKNDITTFVFVDELQKQKGSDASWKFNNEPPEELLDFSDDEMETAAKRKRMNKNRNRQFSSTSDIASKRPYLEENSPSQTNYRPFGFSNSRSDVLSLSYPRRNPFSTPLPSPLPSPSPSLCSVMSSPVRMRNSYNFSMPNQPRLPYSRPQRPFSPQSVLQRPASPLLLTSYQQPHVFGQVTLLNPISTLPPPSPLQCNMPALIRAPVAPESYFQPRFMRSPSPNIQNNHFSSLNPQRFSVGSSPYPNQTPSPISALPPPSTLHGSMPAVIHAPVDPENYFQPRFTRSPSPNIQNNHFSSLNPQRFSSGPSPYHPNQTPPPSPLHSNVPALIRPSVAPENHFQPRFTRNPSPNIQNNNFSPLNPRMFSPGSSPYPNQTPSPGPWYTNNATNSGRVPPNHPLTIHIPNLNSPTLPVNPFQPGNEPMQPFINNINMYNRNGQSSFY